MRAEPRPDRLKRCSTPGCGWHPIVLFNRHPTAADSHRSECRACQHERKTMPRKRCSRCGKVKRASLFYQRPSRSRGLRRRKKSLLRRSRCIACSSVKRKGVPGKRRCRRCGRLKYLTAFHLHPHGHHGRRPECKRCRSVGRRVRASSSLQNSRKSNRIECAAASS